MKLEDFLNLGEHKGDYTVKPNIPRPTMMKTLVGLDIPSKIMGNFIIPQNRLRNFVGGPVFVLESFLFRGASNTLVSLEGAPKVVGEHFSCAAGKLTSLEHAPERVGGNFNCSMHSIMSFKNVHKQIKSIGGFFNICGNPVTSHVLGFLLIENLQEVKTSAHMNMDKVGAILNKYLPNTKGMEAVLDCQEELIDAGFEDYAQL